MESEVLVNDTIDSDVVENSEISVSDDSEIGSTDTDNGENNILESVPDDNVVFDTENTDSGVVEQSPVVDLSGLVDKSLGGVPVVLVNDVSAVSPYAIGTDNAYQLPEYYVNYFSGVLANMPDTDYVAYATRTYVSNYQYEEHYYLIYDVKVENDSFVSGSYPYIDIYRNSSGGYSLIESYDSLYYVPAFSYGSFGHLSDLRKGDSYGLSLSFLFAFAFLFLYFVVSHIFSNVLAYRKGSRG